MTDEEIMANAEKAEERIEGTPRERLDKMHFYIDWHTSCFYPHVNLLSDFEPDGTFLTKERVEKIVAEARVYEIRYLVHYREVGGGPEYIEQFACRSRKQLRLCTREYNRDLCSRDALRTPQDPPLVIVSIIDLARISPVKLQQWVDSFYMKVPDQFDYCLRHPVRTHYSLDSDLSKKFREAKGLDDLAS